MKLREGNVFTHVCLSKGGVSHHAPGQEVCVASVGVWTCRCGMGGFGGRACG